MPKKKILVVDDEVHMTRFAKILLEDSGEYEVRTENLGAKAFKAAIEFQPALVLLDVIMPDLDGASVASLIKEDERTKHIPIAFLTATVTKEEVGPTGMEIGGRPYISKPVGRELLDFVKRIIK